MVEAVNQEEQKGEEEVVATTYALQNYLATWTDDDWAAKKSEIEALVEAWGPYTDKKDTYRDPEASGHGGFECKDDDQISLLRSAVTEIVKVSNLTGFVWLD